MRRHAESHLCMKGLGLYLAACGYVLVGTAVSYSATGDGLILDRDPQAGEVSYAPADGATATVNPPAFVWLPVPTATKYLLQISRSPEFPANATIQRECGFTLEVPRQSLDPGTWFWRFGVVASKGATPLFSRTRAFEMPLGVPLIPFPDTRELIRRLSGVRPRIAVPPGQIGKWRELGRGALKPALDATFAAAEKEIGQPLMAEPPYCPPPNDPGYGPAQIQMMNLRRQFGDGMVRCAEAYLLTGEKRLGSEARRRLMDIVSWDPRGSTSLENHESSGCELLDYCAKTYDYVYPLLTDDERRACREVLAVRAPQIYRALRAMQFESRPFNSHAMDYWVSYLLDACMAIAGDVETADGVALETMFEYVLLQYWSPYYPPFGGVDGGWSEGPGYWHASTLNFARAFMQVEQWTGVRLCEKPWMRQTPYFKLYCNPPYNKMSPFGDGNTEPPRYYTMHALAAMLHNPYALWYVQQFGSSVIGLNAFVFQTDGLKPQAPDNLPQARCFRDVGLVAMHSALAEGPRNVQVLLRSSPFGTIGHSYSDQNAFVLSAFGEPLAISSGWYDYYRSRHQLTWTRQTRAANSITVDGEGQVERSWEATGRIVTFATNDYAHYAVGDARAAYGDRLVRFDRHIVFLRPAAADEAMVILFDDLESRKPSRFQWWLHALEKMQVDTDARTATIRRAAAGLRVQFLAPGALGFEQTSGFPVAPNRSGGRKGSYDDQWHLSAQTALKARRQQFVTVLLPFREGGEPSLPMVRLLPGSNCLSVELTTADARHLVLWRPAGQEGVMDSDTIRSGAYLKAIGFNRANKKIGGLEVTLGAGR